MIHFGYSGLKSIPQKLFASQRQVEECTFNRTFSYAKKISSIPDGLFSGINCPRFEDTFRGCEALTTVSSKIFGTGNESDKVKQNCTSIGGFFQDCINLTQINDEMFGGFTQLKSASYAFYNTGLKNVNVSVFKNCSNLTSIYSLFSKCLNLTSVSKVFEGCNSIENIGAAFYRCSSLETVDENLFDDSKNVIKQLSGVFRVKDEEKVGYEGLFEGCSKLKTCPKIWEWSNFSQSKVKENPEASYDTFFQVDENNIINEIKKQNLEEYWLKDHYFDRKWDL